MELHSPTDDLSTLSNGALMRLLDEAQENERFVSHERRTLHEKLDDPELRAGGLGPDADSLAALQRAERTLSERRLELHQWITELRMERGRRVGGLRALLRVVE